jgi:CBS domain-containing protein
MKNWTVDDVMTKAVVSVDRSASYRDVVDVLVGNRFSAVPVIDSIGHVVGVVSEADLLRKMSTRATRSRACSTAAAGAANAARPSPGPSAT